MFTKRVEQLISALNCTNSEIAKHANCVPSNISRLRTGSRIPSPDSRTVLRLIDGAFSYADDHNMLHVLCELCGSSKADSSAEIKDNLVQWLFINSDLDTAYVGTELKIKNKVLFRYFGDKLNAVMNMLELSNIRLAKQVNIDPSYISRFRTGVRTPKYNLPLLDSICNYLLDRIEDQNKINELSQLMNLSVTLLHEEDYRRSAFILWICDTEAAKDESAIDKLLESIANFSPNTKMPLPNIDTVITDEVLKDTADYYWGIKGFQCSVIRFLAGSIISKVKVLYLYSDQCMDWITEGDFRLKWMLLMSECVKCGIKIKIIHNVDRDVNEMLAAFENWIPLYMSGMIEPFFCKRKSDERFSHTIFLSPRMACIDASHVKGAENFGKYYYHTDWETLALLEREFDLLEESSDSLLKMYLGKDIDNYLLLESGFLIENGIAMLLSSLSIGTLSKEQLLSMLNRNGICNKNCQKILTYWSNQQKLLEKKLTSRKVYEFVSMPKDDELFSGKILLNLSSIMSDLPVFYNEYEYASHIKSIIELMDKNENYRFYLLPEAPFTNLQIIVCGDKVIVIKSTEPYIAFVFTHPLVCKAFDDYMNGLKERYTQERNTVKQSLMRYM